jgi:ABC-type uncharacterized transport system involved in gliding motility auxiliary subunit
MFSSMKNLSRQAKERWVLYGTLTSAFILFIALNGISTNVLGARQVDLTANKLYTISDGTKRTLQNLEDTVNIRYYFSTEQATGYPSVQSYATRVRSLLQHYEVLSHGKVKVEVINPTPYSEVEEEAVKEGMQGLPIDNSGSRLYFGMYATGGTDKSASIAFFNPQRAAFLEYDLTKVIYDLSHPKKPVVTVVSGLPMRLGMLRTPIQPDRDWAILTQMEGFFDVQYQDIETMQIPDNTDVLMLIHPDKLTERDLMLVDQYLMEGGKALIFTDPVAKVDGVRQRNSNLNKVLAAWGAQMPEGDVVGDRSAAVRLPSQDSSSLLDTVANLTWLEIAGWGMARNEIIASDLGVVRFITAGHYVQLPQPKFDPKSGIKPRQTTWSPLITTSEDVTLLSTKKVMDTDNAGELMQEFKPIGKKQVLAVKITGKAPTAFPEKTKFKGFAPYSLADSTLILVADTDVLRNGLWVTKQQLNDKVMYVPVADNGAFVMNALDYLAGSRDLISLRSRSDVSKTFKVLQDLKRTAEVKFRAQEEQLEKKVGNIEEALNQVKNYTSGNNTNLPSTKDRKEIEKYRAALIAARKELRDVRYQLQKDMSTLSGIVSFVNIGLVPIFVILAAMFVPWVRQFRARRA